MASYRMINQALSGVQFTLTTLANAGNHFLHESLLQIGMRSRERDTMPQLFTSYRFLDNVAPITSASRPADLNPAMPADILDELSQTPVKSKQYQPRPPFMQNDESKDQRYDFTHTPVYK